MHTQSESHVRRMLLVGEDPKKFIQDYSNQFQRDFLLLLRTSHGEKQVQMNHFYQEYIANKEHIHMNSTKWPSLTEFAKHLGREGICRVEETDKGIHIAWVDNSPEALRRQDAVRKKEMQDKGDETREQKLIRDQVRKAQADAEARGVHDEDEGDKELKRVEGEKIKLSFGSKPLAANPTSESETQGPKTKEQPSSTSIATASKTGVASGDTALATAEGDRTANPVKEDVKSAPAKVSLQMGFQSKPKNVFAAKKNALGGKKAAQIQQPKKMSEAERIMKEEIERKRNRDTGGGFGGPAQKKQRF